MVDKGFDVEGLIVQVKKHVFLYDITHSKYKDANLKAAVWESIAQKLNRSRDAVRLKWKTIRDGYIKYKKQLEQDSGKKVIHYIWSSQLSFLDNYKMNRRTNVHLNNPLQPQVQLFERSTESPTLSYSPSYNQWGTEDEPGSKRRKTIEQGDVDQILNFMGSKRTKTNDAVDHLFMSYAETFKNFSPRLQAEMKIQLANLFSNAELKEIQNADDSQPGSSTSPSAYLYATKTENMGSDCGLN